MYQENGCFDQSSSLHGADDAFSQTNFSIDDQSYPQNDVAVAAASVALEMELHLHLETDHCFNNETNSDIQEIVQDSTNWHEINAVNHAHHQQQLNSAADFNYDGHYSAAPDFLNMFPLPRCSPPPPLLPNSSITFSHNSPAFMASLGLLGDVNGSGDASYDPLLPLNLPPQPPLLRELFHSLPQGGGVYSIGGRNGSLFGNGIDEREGDVGLYQTGDGVFQFSAADIKNRDGSKDTKHFATERHRRVLLNDKYKALRSLIPSPTKTDRASVVGDAIGYIRELKRTVTELKGLVEKKRCVKEMLKRPKIEGNATMEGNDSKCTIDMDPYNDSSLRSSWLHRKSKNSEVDVRIIDDEVTVKVIQQKRINCLFFVSNALDELQLDLHHVAGGVIGDYYSYLFNSKICEGSIVYASAVANKLIEVVDKQYSAVQPSSKI